MSIDLHAAPSSSEVNALADQLAAEMRRRWKAGDRPRTEDFLDAHPELIDHPGAVGELIYEEVSLRRERGEPNATEEVVRRFPRWTGQLRVLLDLRDTLEADGQPDFPESGDRLGDYQLLGELGRGRRGRVFLARQPALADRPVVVKLTPRAGGEHLSLARLQHTHIVPLYASQEFPNRGLRVLCMPYFGGAALAHVLTKLAPIPPAARTAANLWVAIGLLTPSPPGFAGGEGWGEGGKCVQARGSSFPGAPAATPLTPHPSPPAKPGGEGNKTPDSYVRAVAQIGACLADALQFAHERSLVHMDVKPSNVLITADGQPMLLDFHLARPPLTAGDPAPAWLGGTAAYLAPEQRAALDAVRSGQSVPSAVDGRADLFALGVTLFEALGGRPPAPGVPVATLNRRVSVGLSDVVGRCLADDPAHRYPDAAALADDLRRHLADRPLGGVRNRSFAERWRKWRRRRPHALGVGAALGLVLITALVAAGFVGHRRDVARAALAEGTADLDRGQVAEARGAFRRGLEAVADLPAGGDLVGELAAGLRRADRAAAADELHTVAERMRALSATDSIPDIDRARSNDLGHQLWRRRADLFALAGTDMPPAVRERARADLLDVVLVWSRMRSELLPADRPAVVYVLMEIEGALGACAGLYRERAALVRDLGRPDDADADLRRAAATPPVTAWDYVALGTSHYRRGDPTAARAEFEQAVARDPHSFWARLWLGRCDLALNRPEDALISFAVCVGLNLDSPVGHLFKGHAHARLGQSDRALADVQRALQLDPGNVQAQALRDALTPGK
jgi:tetratricopeptide (TPR) repeat protein